MRGIRLDGKHVATAVAVVLAMRAGANGAPGEAAALNLRAVFTGGATAGSSLEITLFRWPTDAERAPLIAALSAPPPQSVAPVSPAPGRGGRGGRGAAPSPPPSPLVRLEAAIKAAPTCGYIWGQGVTGYSIKYAWRAPSDEAGDRIVLVTDRRLVAHASPPMLTAGRLRASDALRRASPELSAEAGSPAVAAVGNAAERDFTVIEMRLDGKGIGVAKASLDATSSSTRQRRRSRSRATRRRQRR